MSDSFKKGDNGFLNSAQEELFTEGIELFNRGAYWEAHEGWEDVWKEMPGAERLFVQGLIHGAAAFHQWRRGKFGGAAEHFRRAMKKLAPFPPDCEGLDLEDFRHRLPQWEREAKAEKPFPPAPRLLRSTENRGS